MITYITHTRVSPGDAAAFAAVLEEMTAGVRETEPGVVYYGWSVNTEDPNTFAVVEVYRDEAAIAVHRETDHFKVATARSAALSDGAIFDTRTYTGG
jgi:quinol monooxygenase YgiN